MSYVDTSFKSPLTAISIGPGIRGIERGVNRVVRLREIAFVEREAYICENLVAQMESGLLDAAVIWSDAKTFPAHLFRGKVNLLLAGYPCQPFSSAGQRKGVEDERHLYPYIERTIDTIRPDACFFENVRGHVTLGLREVIESLERLGYRVHWGIFSAEETGASHKRERVFILAIRHDCLVNSKYQPLNSSIGWIRREFDTTSSKEMAYTLDRGRKNGWRNGVESNVYRSDENQRSKTTKFCVSRPGQPQQAWEHPRVISRQVESTVGLSAHGYNFREDVLRALGNSVYEDTAELAFRTLLEKFLTH